MKWKDTSFRDFGEVLDGPNRLSLETDDKQLRLWIQKLRDKWTVHCLGLEICSALKAKTYEQARMEALEVVQERLEKYLAYVHEMKTVTF